MTSGCLVMAYGTPASLDDLAAYYTHIRRGRPPEPEQLAELRGRYEAIGGISPLREITGAQVERMAATLGEGWAVTAGYKHAGPSIEDGVAELAGAGVERIVGIVLAPHFSGASIGEYAARMQAAAAELAVPAAVVPQWHDLPAWLDFQVDAVCVGLDGLPARTKVLFTAHSLPERALRGDVYPEQLHVSASTIAERAGLDRRAGWAVAWQSAGRTAEAWRGPDIGEVIDDLAATGGADGVLVCPQGFTADHLEVLYDLDIEAATRADAAGLAFARTRSLNDDPVVLAALAERVESASDRQGAP